jgi:hypothetical protein
MATGEGRRNANFPQGLDVRNRWISQLIQLRRSRGGKQGNMATWGKPGLRSSAGPTESDGAGEDGTDIGPLTHITTPSKERGHFRRGHRARDPLTHIRPEKAKTGSDFVRRAVSPLTPLLLNPLDANGWMSHVRARLAVPLHLYKAPRAKRMMCWRRRDPFRARVVSPRDYSRGYLLCCPPAIMSPYGPIRTVP